MLHGRAGKHFADKMMETSPDTLDSVAGRAQDAWDARLARFDIGNASDDAKTTLYSSLYRLYLYPNSGHENAGTAAAPDLKVEWNPIPESIAIWKLAPALAAGCTVVIKTSEDAPVAVGQLGRLVAEAGCPPGVVNIVHGMGAEAGAALTAHPDVSKISFTGSTGVGRTIAREAAGSFKRVTLELGGKAAQILLQDANLDEAIPGAPALIAGVPNDVAMAELIAEIGQFIAWQGELAPHFAYGNLTKAQYYNAHYLHIQNHLSEISLG